MEYDLSYSIDFIYNDMRWLQYISFMALFTLQAIPLFAQKTINREISQIYHNLSNDGQFTENDFNFLKSIKEDDLLQSPDSVIYQYHYLIGSWLDFNEGDLQKRMYHIGKALYLIETTLNISSNRFGIFDIEYLWLSRAMADCYEEIGNIDKAILQYERTLVRGEQILDKESNKNSRAVKSGCISSLGELYAKKGYKREAINCFEKAFSISCIDYEQGETETYFPLWCLSHYYGEEKDYINAVESWKRLIRFFEEHNAILTEENASTNFFLGASYADLGDLDSAIATYKKAISIYQQINADFSDIERTYGNLWCIYAQKGDINGFYELKNTLQKVYFSQKRKEDYYRCLWAATTLLPSDKIKPFTDELLSELSILDIPLQIKLLIRLADENLNTNPNNTILYIERSLYIITQSEYKDTAFGWLFNLYQLYSLAYQKQDNLDLAISHAQQALKYFEKCNDITDNVRQQLLFRLVNLYLDCKEYEKAVELENILIPLTKQMYGEESNEYITNMNIVGICLMYNGEYRKAIKTFKSLFSLMQKLGGENSIGYATNLHNLGRAYMLKGNRKNAIVYLENAKALQLVIEGTINNKTNQYLNELGIYE